MLQMNITVKDINSLEAEKPCKSIIHVKVVERRAVTRYKKDGGDEKVMASVILGDKTASIKALVYDLCNLEMLHVNTGMQIQDFIQKKVPSL